MKRKNLKKSVTKFLHTKEKTLNYFSQDHTHNIPLLEEEIIDLTDTPDIDIEPYETQLTVTVANQNQGKNQSKDQNKLRVIDNYSQNFNLRGTPK